MKTPPSPRNSPNGYRPNKEILALLFRITFAQKCLKTDLGKYGLPKDQKEFAVHTGDQEFIEKVDKLVGGETKTAAAGGDGEKSKKVVNPAAQSFSRTSSPDIDESPYKGTI